MKKIQKFIPQMEPWFGSEEAKAVFDYMKSGGWVTEFKKTREFENLIANYTGAKYCSATNNGTVALALALFACGVGLGDEVVVPSYTMIASANAVKLTGADVVFADIEPKTLCLDFESLKSAATAKTKAVILVSINGRYPESLPKITAFCEGKKILIIEDAAQSLGSFYNGKHVGTAGNIAIFSFSSQKIISTGQGGAVISDDEILMRRIAKLRDFGRSSPGEDNYSTMGWNFKFTDIQAVIGIEQMKKLSWRVKRKKEIYRQYYELLKNVSGISFIDTSADVSPWFIDIIVKDGRKELMEFLKEHKMGTRPFYPALHKSGVYRNSRNYPASEFVSSHGLWLPSSSKLTETDIERVSDAIKIFFK